MTSGPALCGERSGQAEKAQIEMRSGRVGMLLAFFGCRPAQVTPKCPPPRMADWK
jgi:hypothetical protein